MAICGARLARIFRTASLVLRRKAVSWVEEAIHQRLGYICRIPLGQLGSGRWRAYIATWELGGSGNGNVVPKKLLFTESSMPKELKCGAASEGNTGEGTLSEDMWPCTMRVVG